MKASTNNSVHQMISASLQEATKREEEPSGILKRLLQSPSSSYIVAKGRSMLTDEIKEGDVLVVDSELQPTTNELMLAIVNGELAVKRVSKYDDKLYLIPENQQFKPLEITPTMNFELCGVIRYVIHKP